jgi:uncharacterized damage-inducible protein DinB
MKPPIWFERSFAFDFPDSLYPNVVERLRGTPARFEHLLGGVEANVLTERLEGAWSMQEHLGHLLDLEPLWFGRMEDIVAGALRLRSADLENRATQEANHNQVPVAGLLQRFRAAREAFVGRLEAVPDLAGNTAIHPRLEQPMRLIDILYFTAEHDDHHLAQVSRLLRLRG